MNITASFLILTAVFLTILIFIALIGWWRGADSILFPGLGLVVATPAIIILFLIFNVAFVVAAALVKPRQKLVNIKNAEQKFEYPDDIFGGCGNGVLDLSVSEDLENWGRNSNDRHLKVCINYDDLESIYDFIAPNRTRYETYKEGENIQNFEERNKKIFEENNKKIFEQVASKFPMLSRIDDMYADYVFNPDEVKNCARSV